MVNIRPAGPDDRDAVRALIGELGYDVKDDAAFTRVFADVLFGKTCALLVAEEDGKVIACASYARAPALRLAGEVLTIDELVVSSSARGRGVGKSLVDHIAKQAKEHGCKRIELQTSRKRESYTRGFYKKVGFAEADSALLRRER